MTKDDKIMMVSTINLMINDDKIMMVHTISIDDDLMTK